MSSPAIGFIGLGIMGKPMGRNLLKAGYSLIVHNRSRTAVDELSKEGAQPAANSRDVAARSENHVPPAEPEVHDLSLGGLEKWQEHFDSSLSRKSRISGSTR